MRADRAFAKKHWVACRLNLCRALATNGCHCICTLTPFRSHRIRNSSGFWTPREPAYLHRLVAHDCRNSRVNIKGEFVVGAIFQCDRDQFGYASIREESPPDVASAWRGLCRGERN